MRRIARRQVLVWAGAGASLLALPNAYAAATGTKRSLLRLKDASLSAQDLVAVGAAWPVDSRQVPVLELQPDLVRQWRSGLAELLCQPALEFDARVRWDKAFVLQGLLREHGLFTRIERRSAAIFRLAKYA